MHGQLKQGAGKQKAFSLLELILVIVLLGVMAGGAGLLITTPIQAYNAQLSRQQLVDQAEMALRQIARDIRRALPNSVRVDPTGTAIEMVNTVDGARYRDEFGGGFTADDDILSFTTADSHFNFLGLLNFSAIGVLVNRRLVIYNTIPANIYNEAVTGPVPGIITPPGTTLTLSNPAGEHHIEMNPAFRFSQQSPGQRAFIIDGPISYICNTGTRRIMRYSNYSFQVGQPTAAPGGGQSGPVVTQLSSCSINYSAGTAQRGGIVTLQISLNDLATGETISLLHQVHVENVP